MSITQNKLLALRAHDEVFNRRDLTVVDEIYAADFVWHGPGLPVAMPGPLGPEGVRIFASHLYAAFPDFHLTTEESIAEGDKVVNRWSFQGTHQGIYQNVPPTGVTVTITGIDIFRIANGKIVELRQELNLLGLLQQFGAIPEIPNLPDV